VDRCGHFNLLFTIDNLLFGFEIAAHRFAMLAMTESGFLLSQE
jgi:hypothetical protein